VPATISGADCGDGRVGGWIYSLLWAFLLSMTRLDGFRIAMINELPRKDVVIVL
jgi:hypothetical protein